MHFAHFGLESGMVFEGTTEVYEGIYRFNSKWTKKEREICEFEMDLKYFFSIRSNLSNEGQVWKRVWKITFFWSEIGGQVG